MWRAAISKALWILFCIWLLYWFWIYYIASSDSKGRMAVIMCLTWSLIMGIGTYIKRRKRRRN